MKRTPLKRLTPLKRSTDSMKRTALKPMSDGRKIVNAQRKVIMESHFGPRRTWRCALKNDVTARAMLGECYGPVNAHERLSRTRAGRTDANLLDVTGVMLLCNRHNEQCENEPHKAHALGLVIHAWEADNSAVPNNEGEQ